MIDFMAFSKFDHVLHVGGGHQHYFENKLDS